MIPKKVNFMKKVLNFLKLEEVKALAHNLNEFTDFNDICR
jgi:16S rRNA G527 N7-methylase RsmG